MVQIVSATFAGLRKELVVVGLNSHDQAREAHMKNYTQLIESERNQIYALKQAGFKTSVIVIQLGGTIAVGETGAANV